MPGVTLDGEPKPLNPKPSCQGPRSMKSLNPYPQTLMPGVTLDGEPLVGNWTMLPIPLGSLPAGLPFTSHAPNVGMDWRERARSSGGVFLPTFFNGWIDIAGPVRDTFLSTRGWGHGYAFVNGFNIGRCAWSRRMKFRV
jgi:hypothetical protein